MAREKPVTTEYVSVALAQSSPWSKQTLTYKTHMPCTPGDVVKVPLGKKQVYGVVVGATHPPSDLLDAIKPLERTGEELNQKTLKFFNWMELYYPSSGSGHLSKFLPNFIDDDALLTEKDNVHDVLLPELATTLTKRQSLASQKIHEDRKRPVVLHGVTGSGKTTVYAKRIITSLSENKHSLLIVPEISLISQLSSALSLLLPGVHIETYHSSQTLVKNKRTWIRAKGFHTPTLFIGTRSSLFLPFSSLGVVIIDEAHEYSLKEDHENSHYHGLFAAASLAKIHNTQFIIGSATPPIPETYLMIEKGAKLICLHKLAKNEIKHATDFTVVDLKKARKLGFKNGQISPQVKSAISESLKRKEQSLLFINKLGSAHIIECENCGWQASCPRCDTNFVYHHDNHEYKCNICGLNKKAENICIECGGKLKSKSLAIKSVEQEALKLFPTAKIARFDSTNRKNESIGELYKDVVDGNYDIIIGTQLMAKGFDFPKLSTVGVLNADALLNLPDINTEERLFAQLVQVAGRVGRGHRNSHVLIQTYQADNTIFKLVNNNDWHKVYNNEIVRRKKHYYPPSVFMAKITINGSNEIIAKNRAYDIKNEIHSKLVSSEPFPAFYHKRKNKYYWQIICKSKNRVELLDLANLRSRYVDVDFDPTTLL